MNNKNSYLRFLRNALFFVALLFCADQLVGRVLEKMYFSSKSGVNFQTTYAMDSTKADIIILGSSRASHHYIPQLFEDSLNMSCYNAGRDGTQFFYSYILFNSIIKRYSPQIIIFDIHPNMVYTNEKNYEDFSILLPYYRYNSTLKNCMTIKGNFEKLKLCSFIYPFNSTVLSLIVGNKHQSSDAFINKGYLPLNNKLTDKLAANRSQKLNENNLDYCVIDSLKKMTQECRKRGIRLLLVHSPQYSISPHSKGTELLTNISSNKIHFLDLANDSVFMTNPFYFADLAHLNNEGAKLFTNKIIASIRKKFKE